MRKSKTIFPVIMTACTNDIHCEELNCGANSLFDKYCTFVKNPQIGQFLFSNVDSKMLTSKKGYVIGFDIIPNRRFLKGILIPHPVMTIILICCTNLN